MKNILKALGTLVIALSLSGCNYLITSQRGSYAMDSCKATSFVVLGINFGWQTATLNSVSTGPHKVKKLPQPVVLKLVAKRPNPNQKDLTVETFEGQLPSGKVTLEVMQKGDRLVGAFTFEDGSSTIVWGKKDVELTKYGSETVSVCEMLGENPEEALQVLIGYINGKDFPVQHPEMPGVSVTEN